MKELCIGVGLAMSVSSLFLYGSMKPGMTNDANPPGEPKPYNQNSHNQLVPAADKKTAYLFSPGAVKKVR